MDLALTPVNGLHPWTYLQLAVHLHSGSLTPFTDVFCHAHTHGETMQPQECTLTDKAPLTLVGLD